MQNRVLATAAGLGEHRSLNVDAPNYTMMHPYSSKTVQMSKGELKGPQANTELTMHVRATEPRPVLAHSTLSAQGPGKPIQSLMQAFSRCGAGRLDEPLMVQVVQPELVGDVCCGHCIRHILLVGKNQNYRLTQFVRPQHLVELLAGLLHASMIVAVNHEYQPLRAVVVLPPHGNYFVVPTNVPHLAVQYRRNTDENYCFGSFGLCEIQGFPDALF